jgi:hypothetical protein
MWSEEDRKLAGQIIENEKMMSLLKRIYCPARPTVRTELEAMMPLDDAEYGRQMKALVVAEKHFADAHANLRRIALKEKTEGSMTRGAALR